MTIVERDDRAPHQIRIFLKSGNEHICVGCTCRRRDKTYVELAETRTTVEAKSAYNRPENHDHSRVPFTDCFKLRVA